jgi:hypothetical protein
VTAERLNPAPEQEDGKKANEVKCFNQDEQRPLTETVAEKVSGDDTKDSPPKPTKPETVPTAESGKMSAAKVMISPD